MLPSDVSMVAVGVLAAWVMELPPGKRQSRVVAVAGDSIKLAALHAPSIAAGTRGLQ
jgi:hypothetical protein